MKVSPQAPGPLVRLEGASLPERPTTRFAPSVTGRLHLGHVVNAVFTWGLAGALSGRVILRLEDHDRGRFRPEHERAILEDIEWLGLIPDLGSVAEFRSGPSLFRQSDRLREHEAALENIRSSGRLFGCACTRKQLAERVTPEESGERRYDGSCRERGLDHDCSWRFLVLAGEESFTDLLLGRQVQDPSSQCGDFILRDREGCFSYHFAVTVDDLEQGVDLVIRGEDLLASTGRQLALARCLGRQTPPTFLHHRLLVGADGRKLSKSEEAPGLGELRDAGWTPAQVLGTAACRGGLQENPDPVSAADLGALLTARIR